MKLIHCENPFRPAEGSTEIEFATREEMLAYIAEHKLSGEQYTLSLNGEILPPAKMTELAFPETACVVAMPVLRNKTLTSIALIAVAVAAIYFAGPLGAALFPTLSAATATALGGAIISLGGTLLVNGIASLFQKQPGGASYTFDGPQTVARSGLPIPKGYGFFMAGPNIVQSWVDLQHADQDLHDIDDGASDIGRQWLNIIACFGFGPAVSLEDIRINGNDIASYTDVAYFVKLGTNTQGVVTSADPGWTILNQTTTGSAPNTAPTTDFNRIVNSYPQSARIRCDIAKNYVTATGQRNDTQRLDVTVQFPRGVWRYDENMVIKRLDIEYNVYYKLSTDIAWTLGQHHVYTNIRQSILRQITTIDNLPPGKYDVKVEKIGSGAHNNPIYSVEHESDYFGDEIWLESVQETCYDALAYPNMILLGLRIMASDQISGANIQITAKVTYDTRVTLPAGLASFSHDNPALVAYDVLTDPLVGGGLSPANINLPSFEEWAALCDTVVPASTTTSDTVKLAVFNGIFEEGNKTVWDDFAAIGVMSRAVPTRVGTQVAVMLDEADTPVQVFGVGNIYKDSYSKEYLPIDDRANEVEVDFANADDDYKTRNPIRCIPAEEQDAGYAIKKTRVNLLGCTNAVQAYYWGTHRLLENQKLLRTHKWDSPAQAIVCRIGNVVMLQHDVPQWARGGLVIGGTATNPIVDAAYTYDSSQTFTVIFPILLRITGNITAIAGNIVTVSGYTGDPVKRLVSCGIDLKITSYTSSTVTVDDASALTVGMSVDLYDTEVMVQSSVTAITSSGYQSTLTLATSLPADPIADSPYILAATSSQPLLVRIRAIKRTGDQKFTISAIDYDPAVYSIPIPGADDLLALTSGGSAGNTATTANPVTTPPPAPPTGVINPGAPGYLGSSVPSGNGSYTQSPVIALSQPTSTSIALVSTVTTFSDSQTTYGPHTFTITDPGSTPTWYYVTADSAGALYCETATTKVGNPSYTYLGSILATHAASDAAPFPGGWPIPVNVEANI